MFVRLEWLRGSVRGITIRESEFDSAHMYVCIVHSIFPVLKRLINLSINIYLYNIYDNFFQYLLNLNLLKCNGICNIVITQKALNSYNS